MFIDESHQTVPQLHGMYHGDRSRKETLVEYGFRLPSALDNRPLTFEEFEHRMNQIIYVSATPGPYELTKSAGVVVEQIIRPTGLVDPPVEIRPVKGQIDDLLHEIRERVARGERVLVTTLTKRMAEDLAEYYSEVGVKCRYMHSEIETLERVKILRDLRKGEFDVLIGINLLREGLDLPEVSLVAILDADKEGFLRSAGSLIQTIGRCARNLNGRAILYADRMTDSMKKALSETDRRRAIQVAYNEANGITPESIVRPLECPWPRSSKPTTPISPTSRRKACPSSNPRKSLTPTSRNWKAICAKPPSDSNSRRRPNCGIRSRNCGRRSSCLPRVFSCGMDISGNRDLELTRLHYHSGVRGGDPNPGPGFVFRLFFHCVEFFFDRREALQDFMHAHRHVPDGFDL